MSIKSMTGYGAASVREKDIHVTVELSSVNRKQLDVVFRLPPAWTSVEPRLQKLIQQQISRGRINGTVQVDAVNSASMQIKLHRAETTVSQLRRAAKKLKLQDDLSAMLLLQIPGLFKVQNQEQPSDEIFALFEKAVLSALKKLNAMRTREGKALEADLSKRLTSLETLLGKIKIRAPQVTVSYRKKLLQALEKSGLKNLPRDERILREIALFGERSDISEEIIRLASHIEQFKKIMRSSEPAGRSLDFLAQELFREINTIGSKANDLKVTEQVVTFKTELERIREQIQNVE